LQLKGFRISTVSFGAVYGEL